MLTHSQIWSGIDRLADQLGLSPSGLAKLSGLDATAFNVSKRVSRDGSKLRWPSTESLSKALNASHMSFIDFAALASDSTQARRIPVLGLAQAGNDGFFDDAGFPVGSGWDEIEFPGLPQYNAYALEISGHSMAPVLREGDKIIVVPDAPTRRGDRVVVKTSAGEVMAKELGRSSAHDVELISLNHDHEDRLIPTRDLVWIARIIWVSQ